MRFWLFSVGCDRLLLADCSLLRRAENGQKQTFGYRFNPNMARAPKPRILKV
jgi:hypothetical protein